MTLITTKAQSVDASSHTSSYRVLPWIMSFLRPYKVKVFAAVVFLFIGSLAWLSLGQGVKLMVDEGFIADNAARLNEIILLESSLEEGEEETSFSKDEITENKSV